MSYCCLVVAYIHNWIYANNCWALSCVTGYIFCVFILQHSCTWKFSYICGDKCATYYGKKRSVCLMNIRDTKCEVFKKISNYSLNCQILTVVHRPLTIPTGSKKKKTQPHHYSGPVVWLGQNYYTNLLRFTCKACYVWCILVGPGNLVSHSGIHHNMSCYEKQRQVESSVICTFSMDMFLHFDSFSGTT